MNLILVELLLLLILAAVAHMTPKPSLLLQLSSTTMDILLIRLITITERRHLHTTLTPNLTAITRLLLRIQVHPVMNGVVHRRRNPQPDTTITTITLPTLTLNHHHISIRRHLLVMVGEIMVGKATKTTPHSHTITLLLAKEHTEVSLLLNWTRKKID